MKSVLLSIALLMPLALWAQDDASSFPSRDAQAATSDARAAMAGDAVGEATLSVPSPGPEAPRTQAASEALLEPPSADADAS